MPNPTMSPTARAARLADYLRSIGVSDCHTKHCRMLEAVARSDGYRNRHEMLDKLPRADAKTGSPAAVWVVTDHYCDDVFNAVYQTIEEAKQHAKGVVEEYYNTGDPDTLDAARYWEACQAIDAWTEAQHEPFGYSTRADISIEKHTLPVSVPKRRLDVGPSAYANLEAPGNKASFAGIRGGLVVSRTPEGIVFDKTENGDVVETHTLWWSDVLDNWLREVPDETYDQMALGLAHGFPQQAGCGANQPLILEDGQALVEFGVLALTLLQNGDAIRLSLKARLNGVSAAAFDNLGSIPA